MAEAGKLQNLYALLPHSLVGGPCLDAETGHPSHSLVCKRTILLWVRRHPPMQLHPVADQLRRYRQFM
jgi:hypothetical protein